MVVKKPVVAVVRRRKRRAKEKPARILLTVEFSRNHKEAEAALRELLKIAKEVKAAALARLEQKR